MKTKPVCQTLLPWLKDNLGNHCLGVLTSTDARALAAAVHVIELYAYDSSQDNVMTFGDLVRRMQPTARPLAFHAIAHVLDWPDRFRIWEGAGLDPLANPGRCKYE